MRRRIIWGLLWRTGLTFVRHRVPDLGIVLTLHVIAPMTLVHVSAVGVAPLGVGRVCRVAPFAFAHHSGMLVSAACTYDDKQRDWRGDGRVISSPRQGDSRAVLTNPKQMA